MFLSTNGHNSENPVEDSLPNGSHAVNGSPGPPQKRSDKDASSETGTGTGTGTETPSEQENWGRSSSKTSLLLSSKMFLSPNGHNSENPVEDSLPNGSHAVNGSPGPPQERSDKDDLSETGTA
ncbi:hypothetical protein FCM35_KLT21976 [Carex littledalei]|uniref:Uncharacterized protein n=1 Tax=Carex littledalei TaxID=544730 RepID=A0A833Q762_9POAL|nr:hypothetical protein FCM35_KLT21976 [Carex littledalei]